MNLKPLLIAAATMVMAFAADAPVGVGGTWNVASKSDHVFNIGMELAQDGEKVTGTLMMPQGDVAMKGEFREGALVLSAQMKGAGQGHEPETTEMKLSATLKEDGTLAGAFTFGKSKMPFTAERFKKRPAQE